MTSTVKIPEGWIETTLGEIIELVGGGTPKTSEPSFWNGDIPWLSVVDFNNGNRRVSTTEKTITEKGLKNSSTKLLNKGDLIISARGTVGALAQLKKDMAFNQSCYGIKEIDGKSDISFLYYLIKHSLKILTKNVHGAVFDTITRETFNFIDVILPPLPEQKAIAGVLSSFDDKIELLRAENQTLEEMGQTLFKERFGKYKVGDELPDGWKVGKLGDIIQIKQGNYVPIEYISDNKIGNNKYPIYGGDGIRGYIETYLYKEPEVILTCRGNGCGKIQFMNKFSTMTNSCMSLTSNYFFAEYIYILSKTLNFDAVTSGSAQPQITISSLSTVEIIIPNKNDLLKFKEILTGLFDKIRLNIKEIESLSKSRDQLLPKLMSGEVRVKF